MYVAAHNFSGGRENLAPFPCSRPGFKRPAGMGAFSFNDLKQITARTRGMGDASTDSPCGFMDYLWAPSTDCCNYLQATDPGSLLYGWSCPQSPSVVQQLGTTVGTAVGSTVGSAVQAAVNPPGATSTNWTMIGVLAAVAIGAVIILKK